MDRGKENKEYERIGETFMVGEVRSGTAGRCSSGNTAKSVFLHGLLGQGAPQFVKATLRCRLQDSKFVRDKQNKRSARAASFGPSFVFFFFPPAPPCLRSFEREDATGMV